MRDLLPVVLGGSGEDGPLLRTALALAACAGRGFRMARFGEGRGGPGLGPADLAAVGAVGALCGASIVGAERGATELSFEPRHAARPVSGLTVEAGGAAGPLLLTLCWPLALAGAASTVTIRGATHGASGPGFHELVLAWGPALARLGFRLSLSLGRAGFEGGEGELFARVEPAHPMPPLDLRHRGLLREVRVLAFTGGGAAAAAGHGLAERAVRGLRRLGVAAEAEAMALPASEAEGAQVLVLATFERARTAHAAVPGPAGGPDAAAEVVTAFREQLHSGGATDPGLGAQLLLPAALLAARIVPPPVGLVPVTRWSVGRVTRPLLDGVALLPRLLDVSAAVFGREGEPGEVRVAPADASPDVLPLRRDGEPHDGATAAASS